MSSSTMAGEWGLRASLPLLFSAVLALTVLVAACGGPKGSEGPRGSTTVGASAPAASPADGVGSAAPPAESAHGEAGDLARLGGANLEIAPYPVGDALVAQGGDAISSMLQLLGIAPADVELTLAVAPGGDPTISDWRLPGASAEAILEAWADSAPGPWSSATLSGVPALRGNGPDGSSAWAVAGDGRFVYIRTGDLATAEEVATVLGP